MGKREKQLPSKGQPSPPLHPVSSWGQHPGDKGHGSAGTILGCESLASLCTIPGSNPRSVFSQRGHKKRAIPSVWCSAKEATLCFTSERNTSCSGILKAGVADTRREGERQGHPQGEAAHRRPRPRRPSHLTLEYSRLRCCLVSSSQLLLTSAM